MANIKTAVSIEESLFEKIDELAREMKVSCSRLFVIAAEEFIRRRQNRQLLEKIDAALDDEPDKSEELRLRKMRRLHRRVVERAR